MPTPQTNQVEANQTVAGQLKQLLSADSPYLEQGRQAGLMTASRRGLQNSTMAVQAGEQGRIAAALPIAQQDAATQAQRAELNQNTVNRFGENEMDHLQSMIERAQQGDINARLQLDQYGYNSALSAQENVQRLEQLAAQGDINAQLALQQFGFSTQLQEQQGQIQSQLSSQDAAQRLIEQAAQGDINSRLQLEQFGFSSQLSAQENVQRLEQLAAQGDVQARLRLLDFNYTTLTNATQQGYALELNSQQFQNSQSLLMQEFANSQNLSEQQSQERIDQLNAQHENTLVEIGARAEADTEMRGSDYGFQLQSQYLGQVAARQQSASEEIRIIMQTEGLSSYQQQAAVAAAQRRMDADVRALQTYYSSSPQWIDPIVPDTSGGLIPGTTATVPPATVPPVTPGYPVYDNDRYDRR